jgi:hypothetical protein
MRMALGAQRENIYRFVLRDGLLPVAAGAAAGMAATFGLARAVGNLLFEVSPYDPGIAAGLRLEAEASTMEYACKRGSREERRERIGASLARNSAKKSGMPYGFRLAKGKTIPGGAVNSAIRRVRPAQPFWKPGRGQNWQNLIVNTPSPPDNRIYNGNMSAHVIGNPVPTPEEMGRFSA